LSHGLYSSKAPYMRATDKAFHRQPQLFSTLLQSHFQGYLLFGTKCLPWFSALRSFWRIALPCCHAQSLNHPTPPSMLFVPAWHSTTYRLLSRHLRAALQKRRVLLPSLSSRQEGF